jgi:glycosyltransferase involved in cell wall biosynthesis
MDDLTIGYDAKRIVRNATGLGNYGRTLINDLAVNSPGNIKYRLYVPDKGRDDLRQQVSESDRLQYVYRNTDLSPVDKGLWRIKGIVKDLKRDGVNIYHGLTGDLPMGLQRADIKGVVTIHDLIFLRHPEYYNWLDAKIYKYKFHLACREADKIIAISECTKRDIIEFGHVDSYKIETIYQSVSSRYGTPQSEDELRRVRMLYGLPKRYILNVGTIEARKNVMLAVQAIKNLLADVSLVIVGKHTTYTNKVIDYIETHQLHRRVLILHGVPDADMPGIYQQAEAFVYPSRYEGFGIPVIEAIHCGLPVVACTGSCLEEAGGPDSLYVSPDDVDAMSSSLMQVLRGAEGREQRILRSREYVTRFEGTDVVGRMLKLYQQVSEL